LRQHTGCRYTFGAHVFSQYLFTSGLAEDLVDAILDNSKVKQGKRLYGSNLTIASPEILRGKKNPLILLNCGAYNAEIAEQIKTTINQDAQFC
jgi:hypothetical protein